MNVRSLLPPSLTLPWPLPALLAWVGGWALLVGLRAAGLGLVPSLLLAAAAPAVLAWRLARTGRWRRLLLAGGFPLSVLASAAATGAALPAWLWLGLLALLLAAYPQRAWRDAPLFPTPRHALAGLARQLPLRPDARLLDAGCGLGHGLRALQAQWPQAEITGVEWSWPLAALSAVRCPWAQVRRGDMWRGSWAAYDLVYLFQRPESMARAWAKACAEMAPGSWLLSLDFAVPGVQAWTVLRRPGQQPLWLYRVPVAPMAQPPAAPATGLPDGEPPVPATSRSAAAVPAVAIQPASDAADNPGKAPRQPAEAAH